MLILPFVFPAKIEKIFFVKISAVAITFNEASNIEALCETVAWMDETVIVDSYSTDETAEMARRYTDKVFDHEFRGYKDKHEFADSKATSDWIFWIDADERITPELRKEIEGLDDRSDADLPDGFLISRKNYYLGRWIRHSGWSPDYQMRLYRNDKSYWDGVAPHETARVNGTTEKLKGQIIHYTKDNLSEHHKVTETYSTLAAEFMFKEGKTIGAVGIFAYTIAAFLRTYVFKCGFLDGVPGLMIAFFTSYGVFLKYSKLWELNNKKGK